MYVCITTPYICPLYFPVFIFADQHQTVYFFPAGTVIQTPLPCDAICDNERAATFTHCWTFIFKTIAVRLRRLAQASFFCRGPMKGRVSRSYKFRSESHREFCAVLQQQKHSLVTLRMPGRGAPIEWESQQKRWRAVTDTASSELLLTKFEAEIRQMSMEGWFCIGLIFSKQLGMFFCSWLSCTVCLAKVASLPCLVQKATLVKVDHAGLVDHVAGKALWRASGRVLMTVQVSQFSHFEIYLYRISLSL